MKNTNSLIVCFLSNTNIGTNKYLCCARTHSPQAIFGNESPLLQSHTRWCAPYVRTRPQNSWPFSQQLKMRLHAMRLVVPEQYNPALFQKKKTKSLTIVPACTPLASTKEGRPLGDPAWGLTRGRGTRRSWRSTPTSSCVSGPPSVSWYYVCATATAAPCGLLLLFSAVPGGACRADGICNQMECPAYYCRWA